MSPDRTAPDRTAPGRTPPEWLRLLRRTFLALAVAGVVGTAAELAMLRHWNTPVELIPWAALAVVAGAIVLLVVRPIAGVIRVVRGVALVVGLSALYGVARHVVANHDTGLLDFRYATSWTTMSAPSRWWAPLTQAVGPAPTLAPLVLAQAALCLAAATLGRAPAPARSPRLRPAPGGSPRPTGRAGRTPGRTAGPGGRQNGPVPVREHTGRAPMGAGARRGGR